MKILVTGAAGLIGSHTIDLLLEKGHIVHGIDDLSFGDKENIKDAIKHPNFMFIEGKVQHLPIQNYQYDVIYHFASMKKAWDGSITPNQIMNINFDMVKHLESITRTNRCKLIFASTSDIYGNSETFKEEDDITMGPPTNPRYSYALSKWHGEQYILNSDIKSTIIRIFGCASKRSNKTWSGGHVPLFVNKIINGENIEIHGDGLQTRSISHAEDIARGFVSILDKPEETNKQIINLGTDQQTSVRYVAEYIINKIGIGKSKIIHTPIEEIFGNYNEIMIRFANTEKAKRILDYKVNYTTEQVIDEIIKSYE